MSYSPIGGYREPSAEPLRFPAMSKTTRSVYLVIVSVMTLLFFSFIGLWTTAMVTMPKSTPGGRPPQPDDGLLMTGMICMFVFVFMLYGQVAAALVWLHKAWSWLPWQERYTKHWKGWISPGQASLFLLIPYFHYYWMFIANIGLCDAMDRLRVTYPTSQPAPKNLAIAACILQLILPFPVAAIFWLVYMTKIERMTREMSLAGAQRVVPV